MALNLARTVFRGPSSIALTKTSRQPRRRKRSARSRQRLRRSRSQYQEAAQTGDSCNLARAPLRDERASVNVFTAGAVNVGTPSVSAPLLYTLIEDVALGPVGRVVALCRATRQAVVTTLRRICRLNSRPRSSV